MPPFAWSLPSSRKLFFATGRLERSIFLSSLLLIVLAAPLRWLLDCFTSAWPLGSFKFDVTILCCSKSSRLSPIYELVIVSSIRTFLFWLRKILWDPRVSSFTLDFGALDGWKNRSISGWLMKSGPTSRHNASLKFSSSTSFLFLLWTSVLTYLAADVSSISIV